MTDQSDAHAQLLNALMLMPQPYEEWRAANVPVGGENSLARTLRYLGQFARQAPVAAAGLRAPMAGAGMRAFNPAAPESPIPRAPLDVAQTAYELALGRPPNGAPGSGHTPGGWPKSPLAWAGAAGTGYGIWTYGGGPDLLRDWREHGPDINGLARDVLSGAIADKFRRFQHEERGGVPYPPDPSKP